MVQDAVKTTCAKTGGLLEFQLLRPCSLGLSNANETLSEQ
jgi:hypothetical protein